uniref:Sm protein G n=1 Tax=Helianthus annuus TaxID=4232 RepID=A0A251T1W5_HELAN
MSRSGQPPDLKKYMDKQLQKRVVARATAQPLIVNAKTNVGRTTTATTQVQNLQSHIVGNLISGSALSRASGDLILFKLNANRTVVGTLRGFDQFMNLVIDNIVGKSTVKRKMKSAWWLNMKVFLRRSMGKNVINIQNLTKICGHKLRARIKEKCTG